jgi:hypothetical protein
MYTGDRRGTAATGRQDSAASDVGRWEDSGRPVFGFTGITPGHCDPGDLAAFQDQGISSTARRSAHQSPLCALDLATQLVPTLVVTHVPPSLGMIQDGTDSGCRPGQSPVRAGPVVTVRDRPGSTEKHQLA